MAQPIFSSVNNIEEILGGLFLLHFRFLACDQSSKAGQETYPIFVITVIDHLPLFDTSYLGYKLSYF